MIRRWNLAAFVTLIYFLVQGCDSDPMAVKERELCAFTPSNQQFDSTARVGGKIAVVYVGAKYRPDLYGDCDLDGYGRRGYKISPKYFPEDMYAASPEELDTLIKIELKKGRFLKTADFQMSSSSKSAIDVYSGQVTLSVINYKSSTLVRNAVKETTTIPDKILFDRVTLGNYPQNNEYVIEPTAAEIRTYLKEFSDAVKDN